MKTIRIGTRASQLALWQAEHVGSLLKKGGWAVEIIPFTTQGDRILDVSISKIGSKGVFTEEIEKALLEGTIDIGVHSAKDLQSSLPLPFEIIAFTEREQSHDVLVSTKPHVDLNQKGVVIGTSATRRVALLRHYFPEIEVTSIRGNLQTRFRKMEEGQCDAMMLAFAGVYRMGFEDRIIHHFDKTAYPPPVGQGAIAIEAIPDLDPEVRKGVRDLVNHEDSWIRIATEREFLKTLDGGCSIPAYCYAEKSGNNIMLHGGILSLDGKEHITLSDQVHFEKAVDASHHLAKKILDLGGFRILEGIKSGLT